MPAERADIPAQPGQELAGDVGPRAGKLDRHADVVTGVPGVEAAAAEEDAVHAATAIAAERRQCPPRIAQLYLATMPGRGAAQDLKDRRIADEPADHDPAGRGIARGRLLDDVRDPHDRR